jgi:hypothetical protein
LYVGCCCNCDGTVGPGLYVGIFVCCNNGCCCCCENACVGCVTTIPALLPRVPDGPLLTLITGFNTGVTGDIVDVLNGSNGLAATPVPKVSCLLADTFIAPNKSTTLVLLLVVVLMGFAIPDDGGCLVSTPADDDIPVVLVAKKSTTGTVATDDGTDGVGTTDGGGPLDFGGILTTVPCDAFGFITAWSVIKGIPILAFGFRSR